MLSWLVAARVAIASPDCSPVDHPAWIEGVRTKGEESSYLCLAADDDAAPALLEALASSPDPSAGAHRRLQRALAIHVMQRLEGPVEPSSIRAVNAADRRLLRDAVHARRGRASPVPEHATVFSKFAWYAPNPRFTNRLLTSRDRENLRIIDKPPRKPVTDEASEAPAKDALPSLPADGPRPADTASGCGCSAAHGAMGAGWMAGLWAVCGLRRRRPESGPRSRFRSRPPAADVESTRVPPSSRSHEAR